MTQTGTRIEPGAGPRLKVLAVVSRFKWGHLDYLNAIGAHVELDVAWSVEGHEGAVYRAGIEGLRLHQLPTLADDGEAEVRVALRRLIAERRPDVVHVMYYHHEALAVLLREVLPPGVALVFECRDPLTMIRKPLPGTPLWELEAAALRASDGQIFVCRVLGEYYERIHGVQVAETSLVVPQAYPLSSLGPMSPKLSALDGRVHLAITGTASPAPGDFRWYGDIIRRCVAAGFVVHTHFHDGVPLDAYEALDAELDDYHHHETIVFRGSTRLSDATSRYDLMGVLYDFTGPDDPHAQILRVGMPGKSSSAWFHGGIPVLTFSWFEGLREWIEPFGTGFMIDWWDELPRIVADRAAIEQAKRICETRRELFSQEHHAPRIAEFYARTAARVAAAAAPR